VHVDAPVRVAARVALRSGVGRARRVVGSIMRWGYSFSKSEGGLGSLSSLCSVKGLSVLHLVAPQTFKGAAAPREVCSLHWWYRAVVFIQWWYGFSGSEGGLWLPLRTACAQRASWAAHGCAADVHMGGGVLVCRSPRAYVPPAACRWWLCSFSFSGSGGDGAAGAQRWRCALVQCTVAEGKGMHVQGAAARAAMAASPRRTRVTCVWRAAAAGGQQVLKGGATRSCAYRSPCGQWCSCCSACGTQGVQAVVVQVQLRRGRPRRSLLATFVQRAPCAALGDAAGAQGRRRASVQHAACHVVDGFEAVGCGLSSGEGGLCSLSSPCSIRGLSVVRCRCPRAVCRRVVDGSERWRYGFSSRAASAASPRRTRLKGQWGALGGD